MSIWNNTSPEDRITLWRNFREEISDLPQDEKLIKVAEYFASFPMDTRSIDFYSPEDWPTPWEILYHKLFCPSSISLLIYYTLTVVLPDENIRIVLIDDERDRFLVPLFNDKYIFNYVLGEISKLHDYFEIKIIDDFADDFIHRIK